MINKILSTLLLTLILSGCTLPFLQSAKSALQITSAADVSVYIDGNHVGKTPYYDDNIKPGEYTIRLLSENDPTKDWQTKVSLNPKVVTVIDRQFGISNELSSYYLLQLEALNEETKNEISIISVPDTVIVKVDGQPRGFSPVSIDDLTAGDHLVVLAAPGYQELNIPAQTRNGYKVVITAQLAKTPGLELPNLPMDQNDATGEAKIGERKTTATPSPAKDLSPTKAQKVTPAKTPTPTPKKTSTATNSAQLAKPYAQINETGTGWLRVRDEPSVSGKEIAKVDVGKRFPYIESTDDGWHKIEYEAGNVGWIAGSYATVYR